MKALQEREIIKQHLWCRMLVIWVPGKKHHQVEDFKRQQSNYGLINDGGRGTGQSFKLEGKRKRSVESLYL